MESSESRRAHINNERARVEQNNNALLYILLRNGKTSSRKNRPPYIPTTTTTMCTFACVYIYRKARADSNGEFIYAREELDKRLFCLSDVRLLFAGDNYIHSADILYMENREYIIYSLGFFCGVYFYFFLFFIRGIQFEIFRRMNYSVFTQESVLFFSKAQVPFTLSLYCESRITIERSPLAEKEYNSIASGEKSRFN